MWDVNYYRALSDKLKEAILLTSATLEKLGYSERIENVYELIEVNELGIALEDLCENLCEFSCPVPQKAYDLIEEAGTTMQIDSKRWEILKSQITG